MTQYIARFHSIARSTKCVYREFAKHISRANNEFLMCSANGMSLCPAITTPPPHASQVIVVRCCGCAEWWRRNAIDEVYLCWLCCSFFLGWLDCSFRYTSIQHVPSCKTTQLWYYVQLGAYAECLNDTILFGYIFRAVAVLIQTAVFIKAYWQLQNGWDAAHRRRHHPIKYILRNNVTRASIMVILLFFY